MNYISYNPHGKHPHGEIVIIILITGEEMEKQRDLNNFSKVSKWVAEAGLEPRQHGPRA